MNLTRNFFSGFEVEYVVPSSAKILFISDFFLKDLEGGAEFTLDALIEQSSGIEYYRVHSSSVTVEFLRKHKDRKIVFGNFTKIQSPDVFKELETGQYDYSIIEFDFKGCKYRSFNKHLQEARIPCDCHTTEHGKTIATWYKNSRRMFWMSERQRDIALEKLGLSDLKLLETHSMILSSVFDKRLLKLLKQIRETTTHNNLACILPDNSSWIKGVEQTKAFCSVKGIEYQSLPKLPYKEFLQNMAKYKTFVFMPSDYDTCPRTVIEAKLLGCETMLNKNVLHAKESWFSGTVEEVEKYLLEKPSMFWSVI